MSVTVQIRRLAGLGWRDDICIDICGGMDNGGSTLIVAVPHGHAASDVRITHSEGNGLCDVCGRFEKYSFTQAAGGAE